MRRYSFIFCLLIVFACSCQKLDREFRTTRTKEEIDESYGNVQGLMTAVYTDLVSGFTAMDGALMASAADEAEFTNEQSQVQIFNSGNWNAITNPDGAWTQSYRMIREANILLSSRDKINLDGYKLNPDPAAQAIYKTYSGNITRWGYEARFLRAYAYFDLIKRYGGVPILNDMLTLESNFSDIKRNTLQQCVSFILSECDSAIANLPPNPGVSYDRTIDLGRATKYAAMALKSRLLLYVASDLFNDASWAGGYDAKELISITTGTRQEKWKAAADASKQAIDSLGAFTLGAYPALFAADNFKNPEVIFCRRGPATSNFESINFPIGFSGAQSGNTPSQNLVDAYEYINNGVASDFDWSNAAMAADPYSKRDPRLAMTIVTNNSKFGNPNRTVEIWQGGRDGKPIANASKTGYYLRKYVQETLDLSKSQTGVHSWIIFRIAELYLNYAEALNEYAPGNPDIKIYYDKVRKRTGVNMPALSETGQNQVRERIRRERRIEFAFEDHRFWDVRRWMIAPATIGAPLRGVDIARPTTGIFTYSPFTLENRIFEPKMYLYPIPQLDINIAGTLKQNPLW